MPDQLPVALVTARKAFDKYGISLTTAALFLLFCWLLAHWTWVSLGMFAPHGVAPGGPGVLPVDTQAAGRIAAGQLFGRAAEEIRAAPAAPPPVPQAPLNIHLKGVFAPVGPLPGVAVININGRDQPVRAGGEIIPGVTLKTVLARAIEIQRNGVVERIEFEDLPAAAVGTAPRPPQAAAAVVPGRGVLAPQPGQPGAAAGGAFKLNVQNLGENNNSFSRSELNLALQDTKQIANVGRVGQNPTGGVLVEGAPPGSLAEKLGLKQGDVLRQVNGQAINSQGDLAHLYQEFGQAAQVRLQGDRAGKPLVLNFNIQP